MATKDFLDASIRVVKGQWTWNEAIGELRFQSSSKSRVSCSRQRPWLPETAPKPKPNVLQPEDNKGTISLQDIKVAAVKLIDDNRLKRTRRASCELFDSYYRTQEVDTLLWATLMYYKNLKEHICALSDENVSVPGSLGDGARATLEVWRDKLVQSRINLGEAYSRVILGLEHKQSHHCHAGRSKVSRTQTDREFFEVLYEFIMYVVWITFGYNDWEMIHEEVGSFFRTPQFNRDFNLTSVDGTCVTVEGLGEIKKSSEQYLTYKIVYERPFVGMLRNMHSEAHTSYLPTPKDKYPWVSDTGGIPPKKTEKYLPTSWSPPERLGIIGKSKTNYNPDTLHSLEDEGDSDTELVDETQSEISGIIEDEGDRDSLF